MTSKTITISLEAYEALLRIKKAHESFSDVILRLVRKHRSLMDLAGSWSDVNEDEIESFLNDIKEVWSQWSLQAGK
ncbi:MAG: antitoxin VapB family protein [Thermoprotei archaeon]|jgi:predicted CopG family antitoxin